MYKLTLYIIGNTARSQKAIEDLERVFESDPSIEYCLEVADVRENPQSAQNQGVLATPTVVKTFPLPQRRILGDLSIKEKVLAGLGIMELPSG